jgi:hypothetical protein
MRIATLNAARRRVAVGLVALVIVAVGLLPGSVDAQPHRRMFYCAGAAQHAVACTFLGGNTGPAGSKLSWTTTPMAVKFATSGMVCIGIKFLNLPGSIHVIT